MEPIKITNKIDYTIKINKLMDKFSKEIRENDIVLNAKFGGKSFVLERKKI